MGKRKHKREAAQLYAQVEQVAAQSGQSVDEGVVLPVAARELTMMKKFRFQLLHRWMLAHVEPCRVADVGGGKGLLAYLLQNSGWTATVIDPIAQALPNKYKDLANNKQIRIPDSERVPHIDRAFTSAMAQHFDLLVAMHAHGCNIQMIDAALEYDCDLILLPCCVIHEPILPPAGMPWIQWLVEYVVAKGFAVEPFRLNFKGQNIGIYARNQTQ
jgi:hypothetical protein